MFSLFDGLSTPEEIVLAAKDKGLTSVAFTDHGSAHSHADAFFASKKHGQKVVYGSEAYVIHDLQEWRELKARVDADRKLKGKKETTSEEADQALEKFDAKALRRKGHLVLLACNRRGLANLNTLTYRAFRDGFYGKPRMDKRMLREHAEGLVASSACMGGVVSKVCWDAKDGKATWEDVLREAREFDDIFGRGRFYLELQLNEHEGQRFINDAMVRIHEETGIPLTVTTDFHYSRQEEWEAREILHMLDWNKTVKDFPGNKIDTEIKQLYVKSPEDMWRSYLDFGRNVPERVMVQAFQNTLLIDSLVEDFEPDTRQRLPTLKDTETGEVVKNPFVELGQRAIEGLKRLGLADRDEYKARFLHEMKTIKEKGISEYFVIVQNIVREAKKTMLIGAGRGSSAGSLVCYALGITDLDPIKHGLLFERFLDPTRCFVENTVVRTKEGGFKFIQDVVVGEHVLTHRNVWRTVTRVFSYEKDDELVAVSYDDVGFSCTANHRLLVNDGRCDFFLEAGAILSFPNDHTLCLVDESRRRVPFTLETFRYRGRVFDLEVEDDHSYQVFGLKSEWMHNYGYGHPAALERARAAQAL